MVWRGPDRAQSWLGWFWDSLRSIGGWTWTNGRSFGTMTVWVCLKMGYIPNEIAIFHRDNDQQNHWVKRGLAYFQTHPYVPNPKIVWVFHGHKRHLTSWKRRLFWRPKAQREHVDSHQRSPSSKRMPPSGFVWKCWLNPFLPNGFADHYPYEKWLFHWGYTPFSDIPKWFTRNQGLQRLQMRWLFCWPCLEYRQFTCSWISRVIHRTKFFCVSYACVSPTLLWMTAKSKENHLGWFSNILKRKKIMGRLPSFTIYRCRISHPLYINRRYRRYPLVVQRPWIIPIFERYIIINLESRKLVNQQPQNDRKVGHLEILGGNIIALPSWNYHPGNTFWSFWGLLINRISLVKLDNSPRRCFISYINN